MSAPPPHPAARRSRYVRITFVALLGIVGSYTLATAAAFLYLRHEGLRALRFPQVAFPPRWPDVVRARGEHQLLLAHAWARTGNLREALAYARSGLARAPGNRDGRILYGRLLAAHNPTAARETLLDGIRHHRADPVYLTEVFTFLLHRQEDAEVVRLARELIPAPEISLEARHLSAVAAATASQLRGDYDEADRFLAAVPGTAASRDGRLLAARIDWDRGYRDLALLGLNSLANAFPHDAEIFGERVRRLRQLGRADEARRACVAFQIAHPELPAARLDLLHAYRAAGDAASLSREVDTLLRDFPSTPALLASVGDFAAEWGDVTLARRIVALARERAYPLEAFAFLVVESAIAAGDYEGALDAADRLVAENPEWVAHSQPLLDSLRAVAAFGAGDTTTARLYLGNFLRQPYVRADNLLALANRLGPFGADAHVRDILARAVAVDPLNQSALTRLIEHDLNANRIDDLPAYLTALLSMRRPSPDLLRVARHKLGSDRFLYSAARGPALDAIATALARNPGPVASLNSAALEAP